MPHHELEIKLRLLLSLEYKYDSSKVRNKSINPHESGVELFVIMSYK